MQRWKLKTRQVRAQRALLDITQKYMADALGVSVSTYHRWENGQALSTETLDQVLAALRTASRHRSRLAQLVDRPSTPAPSCTSHPAAP
jgi:transcriptional regulator with XRE-family HTH domain